jgi:DNA polymerase (family 10)
MTTNQKIAAIFYQIADYLEMDNVAFKPAAYRVAAENLTNLAEDVFEIYRQGGVKKRLRAFGHWSESGC